MVCYEISKRPDRIIFLVEFLQSVWNIFRKLQKANETSKS